MKINDILKKNYQLVSELDLSMEASSGDANDSELVSDYESILDEVLEVYNLALSKGLSNQMAESISVELFKIFIQHAI